MSWLPYTIVMLPYPQRILAEQLYYKLNPTQKLLTYNTSPWYTHFVHVLRQKLENEQVRFSS